jgi:phospho-N-acetylmuramoyl-pentapeptide-transferase
MMAVSLLLGGLAFLLAVVWGMPLISLLKKYGIGKKIRIEGPATHQVKMGTPTMGGLMIVVPVLIITGVLNMSNLLIGLPLGQYLSDMVGRQGNEVIGRSILVPMGTMFSFALLGAWDDIMGVRGKRGEGLLARVRLPLQTLLATLTAWVLYYYLDIHSLALPGLQQKIDLGLLYVPIAAFIIVSSANAMNMTDGLDGMAGIIAATAYIAYAIIAYLQSFRGLSQAELATAQVSYLVPFSLTVVGACLAFLWFNAHPAQMFMGGVGSEPLGATLGVVALMAGQWLLLPIIILVPVAIAASVVLQVTFFKLTKGKRLFKMAPLHHHFELLGWSETQVVQRFWLVSIWSAMIGIALALL